MKKKAVWAAALLLGIGTLAAPFLTGLYRMRIEYWTMLDWVIMYSYVYWPTYLLGLLLIVVSTSKLVKMRKKK